MSASSQYFDREPAVRSRPGEVVLALPDLTVRLATDRGVFSAGAVDPGTRYLLLEAAQPPADARYVLDLGCGYGPIAVVLAQRSSATVWAVDVNERALALCRSNAEAAGAANVRVCRPDEIPDDIGFDGIWSNPPVRVGKAALHELLGRWLPRLGPRGVATLVVHKHLGADSLARWLVAEGWAAERLGSRVGYRLLRCAPRSRPLDSTGLKRLHRVWRRRTTGRLALILEDVQTPFNVGSILRTAAAYRVDHVWLAGATAPPSHPGARKVALGSDRYLTSTTTASGPEAVAAARNDGYQVVALELADGTSPLHELALGDAVCLAVGHEDRGLSPASLAACDAVAFLPQLGRVGSLNVAVAAAIALYETRRQEWTRT